jgi:hypothetical protein
MWYIELQGRDGNPILLNTPIVNDVMVPDGKFAAMVISFQHRQNLKTLGASEDFILRILGVSKGLMWLDGKEARACIQRLEVSVEDLGDKPSSNPFEPTRGNTGHALSILLNWAKAYPKATFRVLE